MKQVSVIIPNYNGLHFLNQCFNSLNIQENIQEIIIIDNGSQDGSVESIKKNHPHLRLIQNKENLGFAAAVNQGIKAAQSEFIFLLNNDVEVEENCITSLLHCMEKEENIFAVSSKMIQYDDRSKMDDAGDEYTILGWTRRVGYGKPVDQYNKKREIFSACGGAALYRRSVFEEIGLFDEKFFAYLEDIDISYRARIHGYNILYCPEAIVYHIGSGSSGSRYNEFKIKLAARNNVYLPFKNMPWPQLAFNFIFLLAGYFIKYLFFSRQGHGSIYAEGLKEGFNSLKNIDKVEYDSKNFNNYLKIEWLLLKNTFKFIFF